MARPQKQGLDYFPLDVVFFEDIKVRKIKKSFGANSISILVYLLCSIYRDNGYYIGWNEDNAFLVAESVGVNEGAVNEVVQKAIQVGFFNENLYKKYKILTSAGIQKRFIHVVKTSKLQREEISQKYYLLKSSEETEKSSEETEKSSEETLKNTEESTQSKVKESKVKESKEEHITHAPVHEGQFFVKVKELCEKRCPIIFNRHQQKPNGDYALGQILEEIIQHYSLEDIEAVFKHASKTYIVKPKMQKLDLIWVLNNIDKVKNTAEEAIAIDLPNMDGKSGLKSFTDSLNKAIAKRRGEI